MLLTVLQHVQAVNTGLGSLPQGLHGQLEAVLDALQHPKQQKACELKPNLAFSVTSGLGPARF